MLPGGWVTLRDVYHCAIDKALFAKRIQQAQTYAADMSDTWMTIAETEMKGDQIHSASRRRVSAAPGVEPLPRARSRPRSRTFNNTRSRTTVSGSRVRPRRRSGSGSKPCSAGTVHDWNTLDNKIRSSIVEGVSLFLSMFDVPGRVAWAIFVHPPVLLAADRPLACEVATTVSLLDTYQLRG